MTTATTTTFGFDTVVNFLMLESLDPDDQRYAGMLACLLGKKEITPEEAAKHFLLCRAAVRIQMPDYIQQAYDNGTLGNSRTRASLRSHHQLCRCGVFRLQPIAELDGFNGVEGFEMDESGANSYAY